MSNRGGTLTGPRRDLNAMDVDKGRGGDRTCYMKSGTTWPKTAGKDIGEE